MVRLFALLVWLWPAAALAQGAFVSVEDAHKRAQNGEIMLIDVRSAREWRDTGIPKGGRAITIHNEKGLQGFVDQVIAVTQGDRDRKVALICAAGVRSTVAAKALERAGYKNLLNVREGMKGNGRDGSGWLKKNLPVEAWQK